MFTIIGHHNHFLFVIPSDIHIKLIRPLWVYHLKNTILLNYIKPWASLVHENLRTGLLKLGPSKLKTPENVMSQNYEKYNDVMLTFFTSIQCSTQMCHHWYSKRYAESLIRLEFAFSHTIDILFFECLLLQDSCK